MELRPIRYTDVITKISIQNCPKFLYGDPNLSSDNRREFSGNRVKIFRDPGSWKKIRI